MRDDLLETSFSWNDPELFSRVFTTVVKRAKKEGGRTLFSEEYNELSRRLERSEVQEGCAVRNVLLTRRLALYLVNPDGEYRWEMLPSFIHDLEKSLYSLGPGREADDFRQEHLLSMLKKIKQDELFRKLLLKVEKPLHHPYAEALIRDTLLLPKGTIITDAQARQAVLSALFCALRQSVGSCFATAPAIMIQEEYPEQLLTDLIELLNTGRLKRIFEGNEYTVPLSYSWGAGDLKKRLALHYPLDTSEMQIWQSPGLINALEAVGVLKKEGAFQEKVDELKQKLKEIVPLLSQEKSAFRTSVEELLYHLLLQDRKITEEDLAHYRLRPAEMVHASLLLYTPTRKERGKEAEIAQFFQDLDYAKSIFKGLADNALLKAWEFTLASFTEVKANFSKWNLYTSLGLAPDDEEGIGACMYTFLKEKLNEANREVERLQAEYEVIYGQLKFVEGRLKRASSEKEAAWMRAEYQSRLNEFRTFEEMRDKMHRRAENFAHLFDVLIDSYLKLFPRYFQEIYDPDIVQVSHQYDDSPAGFQLIYKHGRGNTAQWSRLKSPQEFIQALTSFFVTTEREIVTDPIMKGLEQDLGEMISRIVMHIKGQEFIESAFVRMAHAQKTRPIQKPLENLDKIEKKPWSYTSGGSMETLIQCYFRLPHKVKEKSRWVENPTELLVFMLDILKQKNKMQKGSLLMHSPTHAFLLKPFFSPFYEGWQTDAYTYIWARDQWIIPRQNFWTEQHLDGDEIDFLIELILKKLPPSLKEELILPLHRPPRRLQVAEFHRYMEEVFQKVPHYPYWLYGMDDVDALLYESLPFVKSGQITNRLAQLIDSLPSLSKKEKEACLQDWDFLQEAAKPTPIFSARNARDICKMLICRVLNKTTTSINYLKEVDELSMQQGLYPPAPLLFADTNWTKNLFGFAVNPGTGELDLWLFNWHGTEGRPLSQWRMWLDGTKRHPPWGVYPQKTDYSL